MRFYSFLLHFALSVPSTFSSKEFVWFKFILFLFYVNQRKCFQFLLTRCGPWALIAEPIPVHVPLLHRYYLSYMNDSITKVNNENITQQRKSIGFAVYSSYYLHFQKIPLRLRFVCMLWTIFSKCGYKNILPVRPSAWHFVIQRIFE